MRHPRPDRTAAHDETLRRKLAELDAKHQVLKAVVLRGMFCLAHHEPREAPPPHPSCRLCERFGQKA